MRAASGRRRQAEYDRAVVRIYLVGFMGAFTTFSAFMLETGELLRDGQWSWALANVGAQNCCGLALFFLGLAVGRIV